MITAVLPLSNEELIIDPTHSYTHAEPQHILEVMGYLPQWLDEGLSLGEDCQTALTSRYSYYSGPSSIKELTFEMDGSYTYPGDEKVAPLLTLKREDETLHFYPHAFVVVIKSDGDTWMTRMD